MLNQVQHDVARLRRPFHLPVILKERSPEASASRRSDVQNLFYFCDLYLYHGFVTDPEMVLASVTPAIRRGQI